MEIEAAAVIFNGHTVREGYFLTGTFQNVGSHEAIKGNWVINVIRWGAEGRKRNITTIGAQKAREEN